MAAAVPESRPALDQVAFERLYRRHVKDVYRYTLALLQNPADAEDVTQTTFLNAWRAYRRGVEPTKPHNWLIKIAHNAARTRYAVSARRPHEVAFDESLHELPVSSVDASDVQSVLQALAKLPFNQRAALVMRELEGRSYNEIAEALDVSVSAVETLIFRARRSLRVHRSKLRALATVQLPPSLATFFESGGGAVVGGGAIVGSGLLAKAAVVLATGIAAGGMSFGAVQAAAGAGSDRQTVDIAAQRTVAASKSFSPVARLAFSSAWSAPTWSPVGRAAKPVGPHAQSTGTPAAADAPAAAPVDRGGAGALAPTATPSGSGESRSASTAAPSTVERTTSLVTSAVPTPPAVPAVSSPVQPPATPQLPAVPPVPPVEVPHPPKLP
ncbi:MAG: RNA polymerase sigma factor [Actinomycetota bacterium]|nr:RNA polymerase sigma factor [Actinomycetota bacterium]